MRTAAKEKVGILKDWVTYEISPKGRKASRRVCVSISGLRSPTNMW